MYQPEAGEHAIFPVLYDTGEVIPHVKTLVSGCVANRATFGLCSTTPAPPFESAADKTWSLIVHPGVYSFDAATGNEVQGDRLARAIMVGDVVQLYYEDVPLTVWNWAVMLARSSAQKRNELARYMDVMSGVAWKRMLECPLPRDMPEAFLYSPTRTGDYSDLFRIIVLGQGAEGSFAWASQGTHDYLASFYKRCSGRPPLENGIGTGRSLMSLLTEDTDPVLLDINHSHGITWGDAKRAFFFHVGAWRTRDADYDNEYGYDYAEDAKTRTPGNENDTDNSDGRRSNAEGQLFWAHLYSILGDTDDYTDSTPLHETRVVGRSATWLSRSAYYTADVPDSVPLNRVIHDALDRVDRDYMDEFGVFMGSKYGFAPFSPTRPVHFRYIRAYQFLPGSLAVYLALIPTKIDEIIATTQPDVTSEAGKSLRIPPVPSTTAVYNSGSAVVDAGATLLPSATAPMTNATTRKTTTTTTTTTMIVPTSTVQYNTSPQEPSQSLRWRDRKRSRLG